MSCRFALTLLALTNSRCTAPQQINEAQPEQTPEPEWVLVWSDEFDGTVLDTQKWEPRVAGPRRDGWWSPSAIQLDGAGHLTITTTRVDSQYVSGSVSTDGKFQRRFGLFVTRMRFHTEPGHWPAFWLTSSGVTSVGSDGRDGTEIDIVEKAWLGDSLQHALHWDGYGPELQSVVHQIEVTDVGSGYHTFALQWTPSEYVFRVDGKETWRTTAGGVSQAMQHLVLSDEVGTWAGRIQDAALPDEVSFDYVRVYDCARNGKLVSTEDCARVALPE